jgi:ribonucleoside-diphosphate reductase subunit M1
MYYLRSRAAADAVKFTVDPTAAAAKAKAKKEAEAGDKENSPVVTDGKKAAADPDMEEEALMAAKLACSLANKEDCVMCGA